MARRRPLSRPKKTRPGMKHVGAVLHDAGKVSPTLAPKTPGQMSYETWRRVVGDRVAERARPGTLRGGVLMVHVASAVWAQELSLLSTTILDRLANAGIVAERLRFRVGEIEEAPRRPTATKEPQKRQLPDDLTRRLDSIPDERLRAAIAEAASYSFGRKTPLKTGRRAPRSPQSGATKTAPMDQIEPPRRAAPRGTGGNRSR